MSRNRELRATWELYRDNARLHRPGSIAPPCSICLTPLAPPGPEHVPQGFAKASRGHVTPRVTGGESRGMAPECARCNSRFGSWYDKAFSSQVKTDRFRSKRLGRCQQIELLNRRGTWLLVNDVPAETKVTRHGSGLSLRAQLKGRNPDLSGGIRLALIDPPVMWVVASLVHSAYLRLVWHLGYEYVFAPAVECLRRDLHEAVQRQMEESELRDRFGCYGKTMVREERMRSWADLGILCRPPTLGSFVVSVPGMEERDYILFLPGFSTAIETGLHDRLQSASGKKVHVRQVVWDAPREQRLRHPEAVTWGRDFWHDAVNGE